MCPAKRDKEDLEVTTNGSSSHYLEFSEKAAMGLFISEEVDFHPRICVPQKTKAKRESEWKLARSHLIKTSTGLTQGACKKTAPQNQCPGQHNFLLVSHYTWKYSIRTNRHSVYSLVWENPPFIVIFCSQISWKTGMLLVSNPRS